MARTARTRTRSWNALFPAAPRDFPLRRATRSALRTLHILFTGILLGGHVFEQPAGVLTGWLWGSIVSGLVLFATDLYASCAVLFEVRGVAVLAKLLLLLLVPLMWDLRVWLLAAALVIGAVSSHLSRDHRHRLLFFKDRLSVDRRRG